MKDVKMRDAKEKDVERKNGITDCFRKPYLEKEDPEGEACRFPYTLEALKENPIFPYYVMDGGAYYMATALLGSGWTSDDMARKAMTGELLDPWKQNGKIVWDLPYQQHLSGHVRLPLEQYLWINRLYFLIALAHRYLQTGDEAYVEKWLEYLDRWTADNPYQPMEEGEDYIARLIWRNMQVTWRLLSVIHSIAMFAHSNTLTKECWQRIYSFVQLHAEHLLTEGRILYEHKHSGNHTLQIGTALLYVGCLFPEWDISKECEELGRKIMILQLDHSFYPDGGNYEESPSYNHFIVRLYVECYLLLEKNKKVPVEGLLARIQSQYEWIWQMSTPAGETLRINDSYGMSSLKDIETAKSLVPISLTEKKTMIYPDSKCAVLRNELFDVYIDAMDHKEWHQHAGRPNVLVYYKGKPLLADSGCCNYDYHNVHDYFGSEWAHNTVCVQALQEAGRNSIGSVRGIYQAAAGTKPVDRIDLTSYSAEEKYLEFTITGQRDEISFQRTRTVQLFDDRVVIEDQVRTGQEARMELLLHMAPTDVVPLQGKKQEAKPGAEQGAALQTHYFAVHEPGTDKDILISVQGKTEEAAIDLHPAVDERTAFTFSPVIKVRTTGLSARWTTKIRIQPDGLRRSGLLDKFFLLV